MNRRLIAFALAAVLLCCMFPMVALAANETTGETDISVTFSGFGSENGRQYRARRYNAGYSRL